MGNYIIIQCLTNVQYVVYSETVLSEGDVIEFSYDGDSFCGTVVEESVDPTPSSYEYASTYADCCLCLSGITGSLNFQFIACNTLLEINIEAFNFCREHGLPITGMTYEIQFGSETPFCATFTGLTSTGETNYYYFSGHFLDCENCGDEPPRSAGTEVTICQETCDVSGTTVTTFIPPHPEWTDGYGTQVTQLSMITLGGPNGLNN
jgi:hypothetical protein